MSRFLSVLILSLLGFSAHAQQLGLGRVALPEEVAAWNTDIRPDGQGLPVGSGNALDGEEIFAEKCAACHGDFGEGVDRWPALAGGDGSLTDERPLKTLGSYWPYLSTAWDYIYRAMPYGDAASLEVDETYAIVAYLLFVNDIVSDEEFTLSNVNFSEITLQNEPNFRLDDRATVEYPAFTEACMTDCKASVEITVYATGKDVTPTEDD
ncbi:MAG: cytochrome c [Alphaproteobacteria bacterium]|nr:cytochrome c [Alphaproteobacteria bacterium]